jgi:23S rRNA (cytosine1962-C5)-methyltransferase
MVRVHLKPRRAAPFFGRHPWVYAGAIERVDGDPKDGDVVDLVSSADNFVARGFWNSQSKIRVRLASWDPAVPLDDAFFRDRLEAAIRLRRDILGMTGPRQACRLVFSESDGLPGLIVDQYDRWLTVQFTGLGIALRRDAIADLLMDIVKPEGIYLRTERGIGQLEGLALRDGLLRGTVPAEPITIDDQGIQVLVHLSEGQKTGFYLDQRNNRVAVARLAKGRRVLDAFCYTGGFGLHAARAGATEVVGIDVSEPALALARRNAEINGLANMSFRKSDVFDALDDLVAAQERFGLVVLDPPKFARAGHAVDDALRGYRRLQSQAMKLLDDDGILVICCCSGLISRDMLLELLAQLSADQRRGVQVLQTSGPSPDHPVIATCPETSYLKCVICRAVGTPPTMVGSADASGTVGASTEAKSALVKPDAVAGGTS